MSSKYMIKYDRQVFKDEWRWCFTESVTCISILKKISCTAISRRMAFTNKV